MLTDDRLKVTDEKADDHNDMIIMMIITLILMPDEHIANIWGPADATDDDLLL